jgi:hypothetical protein
VRVALLDGRQDRGDVAHAVEDNRAESGGQARSSDDRASNAASRARSAADKPSSAAARASTAPAFAFSASLVQAVVQAAGAPAVNSLPITPASDVPLLDTLAVRGSSPVAPTRAGQLSVDEGADFAQEDAQFPDRKILGGEKKLSNTTMETFTQGAKVNCFTCHKTTGENMGPTQVFPPKRIGVSHILTNAYINAKQAAQ